MGSNFPLRSQRKTMVIIADEKTFRPKSSMSVQISIHSAQPPLHPYTDLSLTQSSYHPPQQTINPQYQQHPASPTHHVQTPLPPHPPHNHPPLPIRPIPPPPPRRRRRRPNLRTIQPHHLRCVRNPKRRLAGAPSPAVKTASNSAPTTATTTAP